MQYDGGQNKPLHLYDFLGYQGWKGRAALGPQWHNFRKGRPNASAEKQKV
jgi:hypothetical protein